MIRVEAQENALGMLNNHKVLTEAQGLKFYVVDGKNWIVQNGQAFRVDEDRFIKAVENVRRGLGELLAGLYHVNH